MELTKREYWTKESMIVHLLLESADTEMSKLATAMLSKEKVDLSELRMQIRAVENSVWYKPKYNQAKLVQPKNWENDGVEVGAGGAGVPNGGFKWCGDCKSKTHNPDLLVNRDTGRSFAIKGQRMWKKLKQPREQRSKRERERKIN